MRAEEHMYNIPEKHVIGQGIIKVVYTRAWEHVSVRY